MTPLIALSALAGLYLASKRSDDILRRARAALGSEPAAPVSGIDGPNDRNCYGGRRY